MKKPIKRIIWIGATRKNIRSFPLAVRRDIGQALYTAQQHQTDPAAKPLKGFHGAKVMEIIDRYDTDTYRAVYTTKFGNYLYVLHAFQKKCQKGIATPHKDIEIIRIRLEEAKRDFKERQKNTDKCD